MSERPLYYVLEGRIPVPSDQMGYWALKMENLDARRVAFDRIGAIEISTVFLGIDHQFGVGPPVLFETMVFGGPLDGECSRYCTFDEADAGHTAMLVAVTEAMEAGERHE